MWKQVVAPGVEQAITGTNGEAEAAGAKIDAVATSKLNFR